MNRIILTVGAALLSAVCCLSSSIRFSHENRALRQKVAELKNVAEQSKAEPPSAPARDADESAVLTQKTALLQEAIVNEEAQRAAAEEIRSALAAEIPNLDGQDLRSYGSLDEFGRKSAQILAEFARLAAQTGPEMKAGSEAFQDFHLKMLAWIGSCATIGDLESKPREIAEFMSAALTERLEPGGASNPMLRAKIESEFSQLAALRLTRPNRPVVNPEDWDKRRDDALRDAAVRIVALLPAGTPLLTVEQTLHLGTGTRTKVNVGNDGHGSVQMILRLPGVPFRM